MNVIYQGDGIQVVDTETHRCLIFNGKHDVVQSSLERESWFRSGNIYVEGFHLAMMAAKPPVRRVLFLGGGGCVGPIQFDAMYPGAMVTVVEKDPRIAAIAEKYFGYEGNIVVEDAGSFVARQATMSYDVVIVDVYETDGRKVDVPGVFRVGKVVMFNELSGRGTGYVFSVPGAKQILDLHGGEFRLGSFDAGLLPYLSEIANS